MLFLASLTCEQSALDGSERVRMLHKARLVSDGCDAIYAVEKATEDAEGTIRTRGEKKRMMVAAAPAYLKDRVERGEEFPSAKIKHIRNRNSIKKMHKEMRQRVMKLITVKGQMPNDVYIELLEYMVPKWDDARSL